MVYQCVSFFCVYANGLAAQVVESFVDGQFDRGKCAAVKQSAHGKFVTRNFAPPFCFAQSHTHSEEMQVVDEVANDWDIVCSYGILRFVLSECHHVGCGERVV